MAAVNDCPEHKRDKKTRETKCARTGRREGCSGKKFACPLKGMDNINWGKVR